MILYGRGGRGVTAFSYQLDAHHPFRASIVASIPHLIMIVSVCAKCSVIYLSCRIEVILSCGGSVVVRSSFCRSIPWRATSTRVGPMAMAKTRTLNSSENTFLDAVQNVDPPSGGGHQLTAPRRGPSGRSVAGGNQNSQHTLLAQ